MFSWFARYLEPGYKLCLVGVPGVWASNRLCLVGLPGIVASYRPCLVGLPGI